MAVKELKLTAKYIDLPHYPSRKEAIGDAVYEEPKVRRKSVVFYEEKYDQHVELKSPSDAQMRGNRATHKRAKKRLRETTGAVDDAFVL